MNPTKFKTKLATSRTLSLSCILTVLLFLLATETLGQIKDSDLQDFIKSAKTASENFNATNMDDEDEFWEFDFDCFQHADSVVKYINTPSFSEKIGKSLFNPYIKGSSKFSCHPSTSKETVEISITINLLQKEFAGSENIIERSIFGIFLVRTEDNRIIDFF